MRHCAAGSSRKGNAMVKNFKHKAFAAATAGLLALSMVPTAAFAADQNFNSDITVNGLQPGDVVTAYEVVDSHVDENNNKTNETNVGYESFITSKSGDLGVENGLGNYVHGLTLEQIRNAAFGTPLTQTVASGATSVTFQNADDGAWLIVVTPASGSESYIYQNLVVTNDAKTPEGSLDYSNNPQDADAKKTYETDNATKKIDGKGKESEVAVQVGETHSFTVDFAVPNYAAAATNRKLVITDTPTGWTDYVNSIKIVNPSDSVALKKDTDYTVVSTDNNGFKIEFTERYLNDHPNQSLQLLYSAQLTSVDGTNGSAMNTVDINGARDTVNEKTYGFWFKKVDSKSNALKGAKFTLYDADGKDAITDADDNALTCTSGDDGYIYFSGLKDGTTYTVKETKVPAGKQQAADFTVTINGKSATWDNPATSSTTETNFQQSGQAGNTVTDADQGVLPTTGGAGTLGFTVAGVVLVAGGATVILRARRNQE